MHVSVADALTRIWQLNLLLTPSIDLEEMEHAQVVDPDINQLGLESSLSLAVVTNVECFLRYINPAPGCSCFGQANDRTFCGSSLNAACVSGPAPGIIYPPVYLNLRSPYNEEMRTTVTEFIWPPIIKIVQR